MCEINQRQTLITKLNMKINSPIDQAGKYKDHGFKNLHIVDLDGALTGKTINFRYYSRNCR